MFETCLASLTRAVALALAASHRWLKARQTDVSSGSCCGCVVLASTSLIHNIGGRDGAIDEKSGLYHCTTAMGDCCMTGIQLYSAVC